MIYSINGPVVTVRDTSDFEMLEMVYVGEKRLIGEVIGITSGSIGEALYNAKILFSTAELLAWTVVIVLLSLAFERLFLWGLARVESVLLERSGT